MAMRIGLACCRWSALSLALICAGAYAQDSGMGVDLQFGNGLDPSGGVPRSCDPDGATWLYGDRKRTPTGFLYPCVPDWNDYRQRGGAWLTRGSISLGYLHVEGDERATQWRKFNDYDDGVIAAAAFGMARPADGSYADFHLQRINRHNQYARAVFGRAGSYRVQAFARTTSNVTSGNARSIWDGVGSEHLTLKPGLTAAGSTEAQVRAVSDAQPEEFLRVVRDKAGLGASMYFSPRWTGYLNASHEQRKGARPFGGAFFFNFPFPDNGGIYEVPRPINDSTVNFNGGLRFVGNAWRLETGYNGSFFRNAHAGFDYQVPYALRPVVPGAVSPPLRLGEFAYEPENDYHRLFAGATRMFANGSELSVEASASRMRQNDRLLPPMNCQGQFGIAMGPAFLFPCANWNTTDALSQKTADLAIESRRVNAEWLMQPSDALTWRVNANYHDQDYQGDYWAFNPLTGQWGYVAENGAQGSVVPGEAGFLDPVRSRSIFTRIRNLPLDKRVRELSTSADWRINRHNTVGASYTHTRTEREHREVETTRDDLLKLNWSLLAYDWLTFRANYSYFDRSGSAYEPDPYEFTFSSSLPIFVPPAGGLSAHTVDALRKYDVASRNQQKLDFMATVTLPEQMTLYASVRADRNNYDAVLGRRGYDTIGYSLQWEWQPDARTTASAFYGFDHSTLQVANVNDAAPTPDPRLGGATYPLANRWWMKDEQRNHYAGINFTRKFARASFDLAWNGMDALGVTRYAYASSGALAYPAQAAAASGKFPDMVTRINTINVGVTFELTPRLNLRVFDMWERGRMRDWHYDGFDARRVYDHRVYTDGGPGDYRVNMLGFLLEAKL